MIIEFNIEDPRWLDIGIETLAQKAAEHTFAHLGYDASVYEISLLATNDETITALNEQFRGKPHATNVLSWPSVERSVEQDGAPPAPLSPHDEEIGDIAISYETCQREALALGKLPSHHTTHLMIHGILHLLGYDHIKDKDAALMEGIEVKILCKMGLENPYIINSTE